MYTTRGIVMFGIEDINNDFFADWSALCNKNINILKKKENGFVLQRIITEEGKKKSHY